MLAACGSEDDAEGGGGGGPTGAVCPDDSALTYDDFGRQFFATNCNLCHGAASPDRMGAPTSYTFDTVEQIRVHADEIDMLSAAGPDATNTLMPPEGFPAPSEEDRQKLGEWLACGAP